jgi:hypothetical protein
MSTPRHRAMVLMDEAARLASEADLLDAGGYHDAALAAEDQSRAFDRDARKIADASGDEDLRRLWP